jgi:hypothetical protein
VQKQTSHRSATTALLPTGAQPAQGELQLFSCGGE